MKITLDEIEAGIIKGALDTLGTALARHDHHWDEGERAVFEIAHELLGGKTRLQFLKRDDDGTLTDQPAEYD